MNDIKLLVLQLLPCNSQNEGLSLWKKESKSSFLTGSTIFIVVTPYKKTSNGQYESQPSSLEGGH